MAKATTIIQIHSIKEVEGFNTSALVLKFDSKIIQRLHVENDFLNDIFDKEQRKNLGDLEYILDSFHAFGNSVHVDSSTVRCKLK